MSASRKSGSNAANDRKPLSPEALRKIRGGQADNGRERPETAVLVEQSIVASDAAAAAPDVEDDADQPATMAEFDTAAPSPPPAWVDEELARQAQGGDEVEDLEVLDTDEAEEDPVDDDAKLTDEGLAIDAEGETIDETQRAAEEDGSAPVEEPAPTARAAAETVEVAAKTEPVSPAAPAAPEEAPREIAEAPAAKDVSVEPAAAETMSDLDPAIAAVAAKMAAAKAKPAVADPVEVREPLVYMTQSRMNFNSAAGRALLAKAHADPSARIVNAQRFGADHRKIDAARTADKVFIQAKGQYEAALKKHDTAKKAGRVQDTATAKLEVDRTEEGLMKAGRDLSAKVLPVNYKSYERVAVADPWEQERGARADLLKAMKTGTAADVQKAQERLNAVKLPADQAGKVKLFDDQKKTIERKIMTTVMKIQGVEDRVKSITPLKDRADNTIAKNIVKQGGSIDRQGDKMASLTYHANKFLSPQMASFVDSHQFSARGAMEMRMANSFKAELLKDLHKLNLDLARVEAFREVAQQVKPTTVEGLGQAAQAVADANGQWEAKQKDVGAAITASNAATAATKAAVADSGKALKTLHEKMAAHRNADPLTGLAVKSMETTQRGEISFSNMFGLPVLPMMPTPMPFQNFSLKQVSDAQAAFDQKMKVRAEKEAVVQSGYEAVSQQAGWGASIKNDNDNSAEGRFRSYAATTKDAARQVKEYSKAHQEAVDAYRTLSALKAKVPDYVRSTNLLAKQIDLVQLGGPQALKVAQAEHAKTAQGVQEVKSLKAQLEGKANHEDRIKAEAKQKLDITARTLFKAYVDKASAKRIEWLNATMNDDYARWFTASKVAAKTRADLDGLARHPALTAHEESGKILENAKLWASKSAEMAKTDTPQVKQAKDKARAEVEKAWDAYQASQETVKAKMRAELGASAAVGTSAATAQAALQKVDEAVDAKNALEVRILSGEVSVKAGPAADHAEKVAKAKTKLDAASKNATEAREDYLAKTQGKDRVNARTELTLAREVQKIYEDARKARTEWETLKSSTSTAIAADQKALAELAASVSAKPGAGGAASVSIAAKEVAAKPAAATGEAPPKAAPADAKTVPDARAEAKAALEALRNGQKLTGGGKGQVTGEIKKESGSAVKVTPWGTALKQAEIAAAKDGKAAPTQKEVDTKTQKKSLESLKEAVTSKSHELVGALARDIGQDIAREMAVAAGTSYKVGKDMMLAGDIYRTTVLNGTTKIVALGQVSMTAEAEAYYSNLGAHGAAGFGLKFEGGVGLESKVGLGGDVSFIGKAKAYGGAGVDLTAKGSANVLGVSADLVAKAHARGEVSGVTGFAFGDHVELSQGGQANADAEATASAGAKLGADGATVKLSASADASVRAAFLQNAKLGLLNYSGTMEAWAKARAEAVASVAAGMVSGEFKVGAKLGASAGAGVGIQETKKIKISGIEFEATLGVHAGTLGASAGIDVGYKNGVLKWSVDVGAALGVGINFKIGGSIDFVEALKGAVKFFADIARLFDARLGHQMEVAAWKDMARRGTAIFN